MSIPRQMAEFHVEDYGTILEFEVRRGRRGRLGEPVDLSQATALEVVFMRPDGESFSRPAVIIEPGDSAGDSNDSAYAPGSAPGQDGLMYYVVRPQDWDVAGNWYVQAYVVFEFGAWSSSVAHFIVYPNLIASPEILVP
jgi:hypothetical protein